MSPRKTIARANESRSLIAKNYKDTRAAALIKKEIQQSVIHVREAQQLLDFAKSGGKAAGWSLLGSASGLLAALVVHAPQTLACGTIGSMIALGVYTIRQFQHHRTAHFEQLDDDLRDLQTLLVTTRITNDEYQVMRAKVMEKHGF